MQAWLVLHSQMYSLLLQYVHCWHSIMMSPPCLFLLLILCWCQVDGGHCRRARHIIHSLMVYSVESGLITRSDH